jgi:tape measure domain-containing protein
MSAIEAAKAYVSVELRNNIDKGVRELQVRLKALSKSLTTIGASIVKVGAAITASFGGAIAALAFPVAIAAQIERTTVAFETLTNSADYAAVIINDLRQFAAKTPLQFPGLAGSTRLLLAYGIAAKDVVNDIKLLGEVAQGDQVRLDRLALAFGQVAAKGRLYATELRQFTESGFSPVQEIARTTNRDIGEVLQAVSDGQVTFADVRNSFITATSEGGRFYKSLIKQSQTLSGLFTTLKDNVLIAVQPFGDALLPVLKDIVREATKVVQAFGIWAKENSDVIYSVSAIVLAGAAFGSVILAIGASIIAVGGTLAALNVIMEQTRVIWSTLFKSTDTNDAVIGMSAVEAKLAELNAATVTTAVEVRANLSAVGYAFRDLKREANKALTGMSASAARMVNSVTSSIGKATTKLEAYSARIKKVAKDMAAAAAAANRAAAAASRGRGPSKGGGGSSKQTTELTKSVVSGLTSGIAIAGTVGAEIFLSRFFRRARQQAPRIQSQVSQLLLPGPKQIEILSASFVTNAAGPIVGATQSIFTRFMASAKSVLGFIFSSFSSVFGRLGPLIAAPFTAVIGYLSPVIGTVAAVVAVVGALTAAITYLLNRAGLLKPMFTSIKDTFNQFFGIVTKVFNGIQTALGAGEFVLAVKILWAGIKVAFFTGANELVANLPNIFVNIVDGFWKFGEALFKTVWDIASSIDDIFFAALSGGKSISKMIGDILVGNFQDGELKAQLDASTAELDALISEANLAQTKLTKQKDAQAKAKSDAAAANQPDSAEGVSPGRQQELAFVKRMQEADAAGSERIQTLQDEIRVLQLGESAARRVELANKGVNATQLQSIALLERYKKAIEIRKEIADRISTIDEEARVLRFGAAAAERFKLAQMGATAAQIAAVTAAQRQLTFLQEQSTLQDDITSLVAGEEAANRLRLQRQGLNAEEIAALEALQRRKTAIINEREALKQLTDEAKSIKDSLKSPLTLFREEQAKIIELQRQGLLTQAEASQAHTKSLLELKSASDLSRQPLGTALAGSSDAEATIAASRERAARLVAQARGAAIAQRTAAEEARQQGMGAARGSLSAADARQRKLERVQEDQLTALETIAANISVPEPEVTIL